MSSRKVHAGPATQVEWVQDNSDDEGGAGQMAYEYSREEACGDEVDVVDVCLRTVHTLEVLLPALAHLRRGVYINTPQGPRDPVYQAAEELLATAREHAALICKEKGADLTDEE